MPLTWIEKVRLLIQRFRAIGGIPDLCDATEKLLEENLKLASDLALLRQERESLLEKVRIFDGMANAAIQGELAAEAERDTLQAENEQMKRHKTADDSAFSSANLARVDAEVAKEAAEARLAALPGLIEKMKWRDDERSCNLSDRDGQAGAIHFGAAFKLDPPHEYKTGRCGSWHPLSLEEQRLVRAAKLDVLQLLASGDTKAEM